MNQNEQIREMVSTVYGKAIAATAGGCGCGCCGTPQKEKSSVIGMAGYEPSDILALNSDAAAGSFGCGNPLALASLKQGEIVLDLGSGAGFDCFLAAQKVGASGKVIGVDMTAAMIENWVWQ